MTIAWDPSIDRIVIELFSNVDTDEDDADAGVALEQPVDVPTEGEEVEADEVFVVKITASYARDFVARAQALVSAGPAALPVLSPAARSGRSHLSPGQRLPPSAAGLIPAAGWRRSARDPGVERLLA